MKRLALTAGLRVSSETVAVLSGIVGLSSSRGWALGVAYNKVSKAIPSVRGFARGSEN